MFSLKLSYLPSSDERLQSRDERSSAHACGLTPSTATFQAQTQWMMVDEDEPLPVHNSSPQMTMSLATHTHTCGSSSNCLVTTVIVFTTKQEKLLFFL